MNTTCSPDILFTGGSGLLGRTIRKHFPDALYPTHGDFDCTNYDQMVEYLNDKRTVFTVVHAAAFTSPPKIDKDPIRALQDNIVGTANIVKLCERYNLRLVYISTDYVFKGDKGNYKETDELLPVNKYAWSKLGGECAVRMYDRSLIIRTTFGPDEFPYEGAFEDQYTSRECVSVIAAKIAAIIPTEKVGVLHVGGKRKTVYDYAKNLTTRLLNRLSIKQMNFFIPTDTSLDCSLYNNTIGEYKT